MKPRIIVPIVGPSMDEALKDITDALLLADVLEIRADLIANPDISKLKERTQLPIIFTNRTSHEGGNFRGSEDERTMSLQEAAGSKVHYIDVELQHFHRLELGESRLIVSYHNFDTTPENLDDIYRRCVDKGANVVKIATQAREYSDCWRMLNLIEQAETPIIGICMGEKGKITRVLGPSCGAWATFASLHEKKASAPGQMTVFELRNIWHALGYDK